MAKVAFVSYEALPHLTADDRLALAALAARSHDSRPVVWSDASVDWASFDTIVLRSCWDYHLRPAEFARWLDALERIGAPLQNSVSLARWNMDKTYLRDLDRAGVPIVATRWIEPGAPPSLAALREATGWTDIVLKPAISATAWRLHRVPAGDREWPSELVHAFAEQRFLAQPFVDEIRDGEWSLVFFDSRFSHAVLKRPRAGDFRVQEEYGGRAEPATPSAALIARATSMLSVLPESPLYARVDGVETARGFLLLELELLEPALFLATDSGATERFADAIERRPQTATDRHGPQTTQTDADRLRPKSATHDTDRASRRDHRLHRPTRTDTVGHKRTRETGPQTAQKTQTDTD